MSADKQRDGKLNGPIDSFHYPPQPGIPAHRTCAQGQRTAALAGTHIHREVSTGIPSEEVTRVLEHAARAELALNAGQVPDKDALVAFQPVVRFLAGSLGQHVTPDGDFLMRTRSGLTYPRNVHRDRRQGKNFYNLSIVEDEKTI